MNLEFVKMCIDSTPGFSFISIDNGRTVVKISRNCIDQKEYRRKVRSDRDIAQITAKEVREGIKRFKGSRNQTKR